jgi:Fic family protein
MSTYANAEALLAWFRDRESATVGDISDSGLMKAHTASNAIQYAVRSGALERVFRSGASALSRDRRRAAFTSEPYGHAIV